eukprot:TRINITY_DN12507_c0_g1_i6.p1 TRINITY_DN12507_c0_g1~~TRINITY_DN12507_c0_g1_i6.p1  ORF type:complete len:697 (+),score=59.35 TRINITY_DN12507_c0_g1_i6:129-2219(+)
MDVIMKAASNLGNEEDGPVIVATGFWYQICDALRSIVHGLISSSILQTVHVHADQLAAILARAFHRFRISHPEKNVMLKRLAAAVTHLQLAHIATTLLEHLSLPELQYYTVVIDRFYAMIRESITPWLPAATWSKKRLIWSWPLVCEDGSAIGYKLALAEVNVHELRQAEEEKLEQLQLELCTKIAEDPRICSRMFLQTCLNGDHPKVAEDASTRETDQVWSFGQQEHRRQSDGGLYALHNSPSGQHCSSVERTSAASGTDSRFKHARRAKTAAEHASKLLADQTMMETLEDQSDDVDELLEDSSDAYEPAWNPPDVDVEDQVEDIIREAEGRSSQNLFAAMTAEIALKSKQWKQHLGGQNSDDGSLEVAASSESLAMANSMKSERRLEFPDLQHLPQGRSRGVRRQWRRERFVELLEHPASYPFWHAVYAQTTAWLTASNSIAHHYCAISYRTPESADHVKNYIKETWLQGAQPGVTSDIDEASVQVRCNVIALLSIIIPWVMRSIPTIRALGKSTQATLCIQLSSGGDADVKDRILATIKAYDVAARKLVEYEVPAPNLLVIFLAAAAAAAPVLWLPESWTFQHIRQLLRKLNAEPVLLDEPIRLLIAQSATLRIEDIIYPMSTNATYCLISLVEVRLHSREDGQPPYFTITARTCTAWPNVEEPLCSKPVTLPQLAAIHPLLEDRARMALKDT